MSRDQSSSNNSEKNNRKGSTKKSSDADKRAGAFQRLWEKIMPKKKYPGHTKSRRPPTPKPSGVPHQPTDKRPTKADCSRKPSHVSKKHRSKKRTKSATIDNLPPRDSPADVTVFEGIRGRSRPAKSKLRKKKKWLDDLDSTKSAIILPTRDSAKSEKIDEKKKDKKSSDKEQEDSSESEGSDRSERTAVTNLTSEDESSEEKDTKMKCKPSNQTVKEATKSSNESEGSDNSERTAIRNITSEEAKATRPTTTANIKVNPRSIDARADNWVECKPGQTFPDVNTLVSALFRPITTLPDESQNQYVAYRYIHESPVMGRVWNEQGKIASSFPTSRREIRSSTAEIYLLRKPTDSAGIIYDWRPFTEIVVFNGSDRAWQPVSVENRSPAVITVDGVQILGQVDIRRECAVYGHKGVEKTILGPEVHNTIILCRKET